MGIEADPAMHADGVGAAPAGLVVFEPGAGPASRTTSVPQCSKEGAMKDTINFEMQPFVSSGFLVTDHANLVGAVLVLTMGEDLVMIVTLYDNECGCSQRVDDMTHIAAEKMAVAA